MSKDENYSLLQYDANMCPEKDISIYRGLCNGCKHYKGFDKQKAAIKCGYNNKNENE